MLRAYVSKLLAATASLMAMVSSLPAAANAHNFKIIGDEDQTKQIEQSLSSCPSLTSKLDGLAKMGGFRQIRVTTSDETKRSGPFLAIASTSEISVAADWLLQQRVPYFDVRHQGEILPDNLCFDLGHLADHVANPVTQTPSALGLMAMVEERLRAESKAYLRAWPYVLEAASRQNGGKPYRVSNRRLANQFALSICFHGSDEPDCKSKTEHSGQRGDSRDRRERGRNCSCIEKCLNCGPAIGRQLTGFHSREAAPNRSTHWRPFIDQNGLPESRYTRSVMRPSL
ncbi:hypothetical protein [Sphingomonas oryzagri]